MLEFNKIYTWEEIVKAYPDLYVFITNIKEKDGEIKTCKLLDVCSFNEKADFILKYNNKRVKFRCCRTTPKLPSMVLCYDKFKV